MARPYRLYVAKNGRTYYLINGKKKYLKMPSQLSNKILNKINIHFVSDGVSRIRRKNKRKRTLYTKKIIPQMQEHLKTPFYQTNPISFTPIVPPIVPPIIAPTTMLEKSSNSDKKTIDLLKKIEMLEKDIKIYETPIKTEEVLLTPKNTEAKISAYFESPASVTPKTEKKSKKGRKSSSGEDIRTSETETTSVYPTSEYSKYAPSTHYKLLPLPPLKEAKLPPISIGPMNLENRKLYREALGEYGDYSEKSIRTELKKQDQELLEKTDRAQKALEKEEKEAAKDKEYFEKYGEKRIRKRGGGLDDGLYNDEIEKITKGVIKNNVIPVIAQDEISSLPNYLQKGKKIFGAIINTNPSNSDGSGNDGFRPGHWVSCIVDARDSYPSIEYFDSLVENKPSKELLETLKKIGKKMNPELMFKLKYNKIQRQKYNSNKCGVHSIKFIEDRMDGRGWADATGYTHWIKNHPNDSIDGEKQVEKKESIYKKYL